MPLWFQPYSLLLPKQYTNDGVWDTQKNGSSLTGTATAGPRRGGITTTTATTGQRGGSLTHTAGHEDGTPPQAEVEHGTEVAASLIQQAMQTATPPQQGKEVAASVIQQAMQTATPPQQPEVEQGKEVSASLIQQPCRWQPHHNSQKLNRGTIS